MKITRTSPISGISRTIDLPVTVEQYHEWQCGALIQNIMPHLSEDEREFIISGITAEEWASLEADADRNDEESLYSGVDIAF